MLVNIKSKRHQLKSNIQLSAQTLLNAVFKIHKKQWISVWQPRPADHSLYGKIYWNSQNPLLTLCRSDIRLFKKLILKSWYIWNLKWSLQALLYVLIYYFPLFCWDQLVVVFVCPTVKLFHFLSLWWKIYTLIILLKDLFPSVFSFFHLYLSSVINVNSDKSENTYYRPPDKSVGL